MYKMKSRIIGFLVIGTGFTMSQAADATAVARAEANIQFAFESDTSVTVLSMGIVLIILPAILKTANSRAFHILLCKLFGNLLPACLKIKEQILDWMI